MLRGGWQESDPRGGFGKRNNAPLPEFLQLLLIFILGFPSLFKTWNKAMWQTFHRFSSIPDQFSFVPFTEILFPYLNKQLSPYLVQYYWILTSSAEDSKPGFRGCFPGHQIPARKILLYFRKEQFPTSPLPSNRSGRGCSKIPHVFSVGFTPLFC